MTGVLHDAAVACNPRSSTGVPRGQPWVGSVPELDCVVLTGLLFMSSVGPPILVRRFNPEQFGLVLSIAGSGVVVDDSAVSLRPGDLVLVDSSRPVSG